jgi:hypothetical protein
MVDWEKNQTSTGEQSRMHVTNYPKAPLLQKNRRQSGVHSANHKDLPWKKPPT